MSVDPRAQGREEARGSAARAWAVFLVFAIAGPPFGLLTVLAAAALSDPGFSPAGAVGALAAHDLGRLLQGFGFFGLFAYLLGGLQAAIVGVAAAIAQYRSGRRCVPFMIPFIASLVVGAAVVAIIASRSQAIPRLTGVAAVLGLHGSAALGCWLLANAVLWPFRVALHRTAAA